MAKETRSPIKDPLVDNLRRKLLPRVESAISDRAGWSIIDLSVPGGRTASVEVRAPVSVTVTANDMKGFETLIPAGYSGALPPLFVPVTKLDTWQMAAGAKAFPLTRKVVLSIYKNSEVVKIPHDGTYSAGYLSDNFVAYSIYLAKNNVKPNQLFSGALKLWILSSVTSDKGLHCNPPDYSKEDPSVNYGMYHQNKPIQGAAACHNQEHSDYSQLLQYMRKFRVNGHEVDIGTSLLTAHPAIWDEALPSLQFLKPYRLTDSDKKHLPFVAPLGAVSKSATDRLTGAWKVKYFNEPETYTFKGNEVRWTNSRGESGKGFWIEKGNQIIISWSKSGSVERWPGSGTDISTTLNFGFEGKASKK
jgi:hypothetical protein